MRTKLFILLGAIIMSAFLFGLLSQLSKSLPDNVTNVLENR